MTIIWHPNSYYCGNVLSQASSIIPLSWWFTSLYFQLWPCLNFRFKYLSDGFLGVFFISISLPVSTIIIDPLFFIPIHWQGLHIFPSVLWISPYFASVSSALKRLIIICLILTLESTLPSVIYDRWPWQSNPLLSIRWNLISVAR